jgi:hypothetical protein
VIFLNEMYRSINCGGANWTDTLWRFDVRFL